MINIRVHRDPQVKSLIDLFDGLLTESNYHIPIQNHLDQLSKRVLSGHKSKHPGIVFVTTSKFGYKGLSDIFSSEFTLDDARNCIAKDYSYENWKEVENLGGLKPDAAFESSVDSLLAGDLDAIKKALAMNPKLIHQRSTYPHESTLLHYTGSNGVEGYRQVVPSNLVEILDTLLSSGADASLEAHVYGGCTAEHLMKTSKHPHDAGLTEELQNVFVRYRNDNSGVEVADGPS